MEYVKKIEELEKNLNETVLGEKTKQDEMIMKERAAHDEAISKEKKLSKGYKDELTNTKKELQTVQG